MFLDFYNASSLCLKWDGLPSSTVIWGLTLSELLWVVSLWDKLGDLICEVYFGDITGLLAPFESNANWLVFGWVISILLFGLLGLGVIVCDDSV